MWTNYLKIAWRDLQRNMSYALINVAGLAVGLACCVLILLFVRYELNYEHFHEKAERIYRLGYEAEMFGKTRRSPAMPAMLGPALAQGRSEVEAAVRTQHMGEVLLARDERHGYEESLFYADSTVFDVFTYPLVAGNPSTALGEPFTIVLSRPLADKYFSGENPVGKTLEIRGQRYRVTGVMQDVPPQTHWRPRALISFETLRSLSRDGLDAYGGYFAYATYTLLRPGVDVGTMEKELSSFFADRAPKIDAWAGHAEFFLEPLPDLYLHTTVDGGPKGSVTTLYIFSAIAVLILLIGCVNYINLASVRISGRSREVGIRKTVGAGRLQVIGQFLAESVGLALIALSASLLLVWLVFPFYKQLIGHEIPLGAAADVPLLTAALGLSVLVGMLGGLFPALSLAWIRPSRTLRGAQTGLSAGTVRKGLVTFQFAVAIGLMGATAVIQQQLSFTQNANLGFDKDQLVAVEIDSESDVRSHLESFKAGLSKRADVIRVSIASDLPTTRLWMTSVRRVEGMSDEELGTVMVYPFQVDEDFIETLGLQLKAGRAFEAERDFTSGENQLKPLILNQAAVDALGLEDPLGKHVDIDSESPGRVVGVAADFHVKSLRENIRPLVLEPLYVPQNDANYVVVRFTAANASEIVQLLESTYNRFEPHRPLEYFFLDEAFEELYRSEQRLARIFGVFAGLAIFVACLGLFGLAAFTARQRTKEIGIRKVLGASVASVVALLSKDFLKLVGVSMIVAVPVAYLAMNRWLEDFAYRIELGPAVFIVAGLVALAIAFLTVSYQSVKAALTNPADSLRYE